MELFGQASGGSSSCALPLLLRHEPWQPKLVWNQDTSGNGRFLFLEQIWRRLLCRGR